MFGFNPTILNVITDRVPALQRVTSSEMLAEHLNVLHAARKALIASEPGERVCKALRSKVIASEQIYSYGDSVYYKREGHERWLGPGKVFFQYGHVMFIRHGSVFVQVLPNRLIKAGQEFNTDKGDPVDEKNEHVWVEPEVKSNQQVPTMTNTIGDKSNIAMSNMENLVAQFPNHSKAHPENTNMQETLWDKTQCVPTQPDVQHLQVKKAHAVSGDKLEFKLHGSDEKVTVMSHAAKGTGNYYNWFNVKNDMKWK